VQWNKLHLGDKMESKLNVVDFSAVAGDDIDELSSLQTASDRADHEVTTIYIAAGTCDLYGSLILKDNMEIEGDGQIA
jgi:hypothetical protein